MKTIKIKSWIFLLGIIMSVSTYASDYGFEADYKCLLFCGLCLCNYAAGNFDCFCDLRFISGIISGIILGINILKNRAGERGKMLLLLHQ